MEAITPGKNSLKSFLIFELNRYYSQPFKICYASTGNLQFIAPAANNKA
jgi:hypothetical protein